MAVHQLEDILEEEIMPGYRARFVHGQNMSLAYWRIEKGAPLPLHAHIHEQLTNVLSGEFELTIGDETHVLRAGSVATIPPNVSHKGKALTDCEILDAFYPVREDYVRTEPALPATITADLLPTTQELC